MQDAQRTERGMFERIVVGVDGREGGRDAIALAQLLVAAGGGLTLAHVVTDEPDDRSGAAAVALLESAREEMGVEAQLCRRASTSVGRGLHELCEALGADLLAVGSSGRGLLGRVLGGEVASAALNGAPCSIAVAPANYARRPRAIRAIGVGYDGSPESAHALSVARTIAAASGAELSALEAVAVSSDAFLGPGAADNVPRRLLDDARARIAALGGVEPRAAYGQPAEELALYSASLDLLIVGSRAHGPLGRLIHGSISHQLARSARCPLLVVTRAPAPSATGERDGVSGSAAS